MFSTLVDEQIRESPFSREINFLISVSQQVGAGGENMLLDAVLD